MHTQVGNEVALLYKGLAGVTAQVAALAYVATHVAVQAIFMSEGPGTQVAPEGALASVNAQVGNQAAPAHEGLATAAGPVGALGRVEVQVGNQAALHDAFAAMAALMRELARVRALLFLQLAQGWPHVAALMPPPWQGAVLPPVVTHVGMTDKVLQWGEGEK